MMSSAAVEKEKEKEVRTVERALKEAKEKKEKETGGEVVVSSYWGITRPKITRVDGTEWPWNCFMVILQPSFPPTRLIIVIYSTAGNFVHSWFNFMIFSRSTALSGYEIGELRFHIN